MGVIIIIVIVTDTYYTVQYLLKRADIVKPASSSCQW